MKEIDVGAWMRVLRVRGRDFHYTSCGIYHQGLFTTLKAKDDPTRECTCGHDEAVAAILDMADWLKR